MSYKKLRLEYGIMREHVERISAGETPDREAMWRRTKLPWMVLAQPNSQFTAAVRVTPLILNVAEDPQNHEK